MGKFINRRWQIDCEKMSSAEAKFSWLMALGHQQAISNFILGTRKALILLGWVA
ncbi:MAG: hypothetical protein VKK04_00040 [Synechococcales bacterium]|nr:hypothetical protein [Synechococcales bacterium]